MQGEIRRTHPGEGAAVRQLRIDQSEQQTPIVALVEIGICHLKRSVTYREIERNGLIVPQDLSLPKFEVSDGEREELFDRSSRGKRARALRKVAGAIGIESNVDHGVVENELMKAKFGTKKRRDLQAADHIIGVSQRNLGGGLAAVYGDIPYLDLQAEGNGMEAADFGAASSNAFDIGDEAAPNQRLEGFRIDIDGQTDGQKAGRASQNEEVFPPAAERLPGGFGHCDWTPASVDEGVTPGMCT